MSKVTNGTFYIMLVDLRNIYAFFLGDGFVSWLKDPDIDALREVFDELHPLFIRQPA